MRTSKRMNTHRAAIIGAAVAALTFTGTARADDSKKDEMDWPVQSLFLGDVAQVQSLGEVQTQAGVSLRRSNGENEWEAPATVEVGVLPRLELDAEVPWMSQREQGTTSRGLENVQLSTEYRILSSPDSKTALAAGFGVEIPTGSSQVEDNSWTFRPSLRAFKKVGALGLNASILPALARDRETHDYAPQGELSAGVTVGSGPVLPTLEAFGELGNDTAAEGVAGLRFKPTKMVEFGVGALGGVRNGDPVYGGTTNLLLELGGD